MDYPKPRPLFAPLPEFKTGHAVHEARWTALWLKIGGAALLLAGALLDWRLSAQK